MTWTEFCHWQAYLRMEPPGQADNRRTAALMAQITNMSGRALPKGKIAEADDFLGGKTGQSAAEQIAFMRAMG